MLVRGHIANRDALHMALDAGIDVIDHGDGLDDAAIERMVELGTFLVPSQLFPARFAEMMGGGGLGFTAAMAADIEQALAILPAANAAGVKLLCGDDYGAISLPHGRYADELEFYVKEAGIAPLDVIRWATRNGAELMGRGHELGSVREGYLADLLVVDGDPLARHRRPPGPGPPAGHHEGRHAGQGRAGRVGTAEPRASRGTLRRMIIIAGSLSFDPSDRADVLASLAEVTEASRRDAGCVEYSWAEDLEAPEHVPLLRVLGVPGAARRAPRRSRTRSRSASGTSAASRARRRSMFEASRPTDEKSAPVEPRSRRRRLGRSTRAALHLGAGPSTPCRRGCAAACGPRSAAGSAAGRDRTARRASWPGRPR